MKKLLIKIIRKFGYNKNHYHSNNLKLSVDFLYSKYNRLIEEVISLYKEYIFKEFPEGNNNRIDLMTKLIGTQIGEAIYILYYLNKTFNIDGDICEFGIAQGATSALLANEISTTTKELWLFDSFEGLSEPTAKDILKDDIFGLGTMTAYKGSMAFGLNLVKERLNAIAFPYERVKIIPGFIEETIKLSNLPRQVSFAYIDFDLYDPIRIALEFLDKVISKRGYIIVDDYDFFSIGAKTAVDEFIDKRKKKYSLTFPNKSAGHFCILQKII